MAKIIIAGGRDFDDYQLLQDEVCWFLLDKDVMFDGNDDHIEFVLGGANGADDLGLKFAKEYGFKYKMFIPKWQRPDGTTDRGAGIKRNHEMGDYADCLIAFWDKRSRGTKDMINYAKKKGLEVKVVEYEPIIWMKGSESVGDGMHATFTKFYKYKAGKYSGKPMGDKIPISYDEYSR